VWTSRKLGTGEVAVSGSVMGPLLAVGRKGSATTSRGYIEVVIVGIGVSDRTLSAPDRQGLLLKMLKGEPAHLSGATIEFTDD
jgi:hypothetical protein